MQEEKRESTAIVVKLYGQRVPPFQKSLSWSQESEQITTYCKWDFPDLTEFEFLT